MAQGDDHGQADRGDGPGGTDPRRIQRLDHADQGAHRHARDRHPHPAPAPPRASAERLAGGYYLDIQPDRVELARYGLNVGELLDVIGTALGGEMGTTTVEGLGGYGVSG